jgi:ribosomal protein S6E (S10)
MTRIDDLRQTLETHAALAPDGAGLVEGARIGAARIRRRRRLTAIAAAATAVVLAAVAIPVTMHLQAAPITPAKPRVTNPKPWEINVSIDPSYPGHMVAERTDGITVQLPGGEETYGIDVRAEKPSRRTEKWLNSGEPVTVQGHPGRFSAERKRPRKQPPASRTPRPWCGRIRPGW